MDAPEVVQDFVDRINAHDPGGIVELCAPGHVFTDSLGGTLTGREELEAGWRGYFALFPDYRIEIEWLLAEGELVLACGFASATHQPSGTPWRIPAAWRAVVRAGRVAEWQVFADNKPVYDLFAEQSRE